MPLTTAQAQALAPIIAACRPHGARRWDPAGIVAALAKVGDRSLPEIIRAATRAAEDRSADSPGVISSVHSLHWRERALEPPTAPKFGREQRCSICSEHRSRCRLLWADDHDFESEAQAAKRKAETEAAAVQELVAAVRPDRPATLEHETTSDGGRCSAPVDGSTCHRGIEHTGPHQAPAPETACLERP